MTRLRSPHELAHLLIDQELRDAGIGSDIDTVFCLFPDDAENVFLVISVRSIDRSTGII